jgi:1-deoxy-D-xylulose-5-phosphate reductoisomerase
MYNAVRQLAILGSTGSIGKQTLDIVRAFPKRFHVMALAAGKNLTLLSQQVAEFHPEFVYYEGALENPRPEIPGRVFTMEEMAGYSLVDSVVIATSGKAGLMATLAAVSAGKCVVIANKEPLVMAGEIITQRAEISGASIMPVDSEHSAIWQCIEGESQSPAQIILTASGGPFRNYTNAELKKVTPEQALRHPSWQMGKKVTIDSATLMNKGLEVIEAHWLFGVPIENIKVIIHPQSVIHSFVEFVDGSVKAQLARPDMRLPIQYALSYPDRLSNPGLPRVDWDKLKELTFEPPDFDAFPCLKLAIEAGKTGGTSPTVLCAADEVAIDMFLQGKIGFTDIPRLVSQVIKDHSPIAASSVENILMADSWAREYIQEIVK